MAIASDIPDIRHSGRAAETWDWAALIGRVLIAAIFLWSGYGKVSNPAYNLGYIQSVGMPAPTLALYGAAFVELAGGLALIVGFKTRAAAAVLALYCLAAAFIFHSKFADPNQLINFFKNLAMAGGLLQVLAFGSGALGLDGRRNGAVG